MQPLCAVVCCLLGLLLSHAPCAPSLAGHGFAVCTHPVDQWSPAISGNVVVWQDWGNDPADGSNLDIYGFDLSTGQEFGVRTDARFQGEPGISGDIVVWTDLRNDPGGWGHLRA